MRSFLRCLNASLFPLLIMSVAAQEPPSAFLQHAYVLRNAGDNRAAIALLEPLVGKEPQWSSALERGKAWNLLGAAYQDNGMFREARHCHETAIGILRAVPNAKQELASALDNLGSVENAIGTPESSRSLRESAHRLYAELGDHAGLARTSNNLAVIAIHQEDFMAAKRYAKSAMEYARRAQALDDDDRAALASVSGTIAMHNGDPRTATEYFSGAIAAWTQKHGEQYWMVGLGYSLRAQAYGEISEQRQAFSDMDRALEVEANSVGKGASLYWRTELLHAGLLRKFGDNATAARLEQTSKTALAQVERTQCAGCVMTVAGFQPNR
jgi:tetratricopeptide (TPR) repeat protein